MNEEIERIVARTEATLNTEPLEVAISDAIANLLILAHERGINGADVVVRGAAHYAATYTEGMEPEDAEAWLTEWLYPYTGERGFGEYIADQAIVLGGHQGRVKPPVWGI